MARQPRLQRLEDSGLRLQAHLSIAGTTGMTAYTALFRVAHIRKGETVYISAAAGAVGLAACQLALSEGCTVIGSAGGEDMRRFLEEIGVHQPYRLQGGAVSGRGTCPGAPNGIDVYLDNVGGSHLEAVLSNMAIRGCIAVSGMIAGYEAVRCQILPTFRKSLGGAFG